MLQFTITGMRKEEVEWIRSEMEEHGFPGSIVLRNLINTKRKEQAKEKAANLNEVKS